MKADQTRSLSFFSLWQNRRFQLHALGFVLFNIVLYLWIILGHGLVPFHRGNYILNAHHYVADTRIEQPASFNLIQSLGQYDSQFFLKIASTGYVKHPQPASIADKQTMDSASYAFSPGYPLLVAAVNTLIGSIEVSAFVVSQFLMILAFSLVFWLVARWYSLPLAAKTAWLVFLYPFSIFYRSYYSEGLFLVLLLLLMDSLRTKKWFRAALSAGLLSITRFVGVAGVLVLTIRTILQYLDKRLKLPKMLMVVALSALPLLLFMTVCYVQTGNPLYFITVRSAWDANTPVASVLWSIIHFRSLPLDFFHYSKLDVISILLFGWLIYLSRKWLPRTWWQLGLLLWLIPVLTNDTMSASRFQIVNLPIFIYMAHRLSGWKYGLVISASTVGLLTVAIFFVNWTWIG